jgi:NodT family efflux transporter outer membrane factor (OMF) lipoprotein
MLLLLPVILLLACRPVGTDYARPRVDLPKAFAPPAGTKAPRSRWWEAFTDPVLSELVDRAMAGSPDLETAQARFRQARALQGVQDAQGGPELGLDGRVSRDRLSPNGEMFANIPFPDPRIEFTNYQTGFDASWELDLFGRQRRLSEGARARTEASAARLEDTRLVLAAEVVRDYLDLRAWQARIALAQEELGDQDERVRLARISRSAGDISDLDLGQVEAARALVQAAVAPYAAGLREDLTALGTLTGLSFQALEARTGAGGPLPAVPPPPAAGLPSELLDRRPDLRAAERDLAAASADEGVAVSALYPSFSLAGNAGWNAITSGSLLQAASRTWSLGPQFSLPLFNRGLLRSQVKAQQAAFDAALGTYHKAVLGALADVDVAFTRLSTSETRRARLKEAEERQGRVAALAEARMKAGEASKTTWLQARLALLDQRDQSVQAQGQSLASYVAVCKALGGGLDGR